eukprot:CAMPEP_0196820730 /NCGR_PEP_ID=MMETSP1362-20130617/76495_1 /TAXON_ID=163516 /ORGANISM="Leptocylindrus danicus, Strain CCMP1856" /LENGTH=344 /DNA_ID=CAMNT_0042199719 /DNA_START=334 /DNA_END=1368 /DNA_ORIENTATION=+
MRRLREEVEDELNDDLSILAREIYARRERERRLAEQQQQQEVEAQKLAEEEEEEVKIAEEDEIREELEEEEENEEPIGTTEGAETNMEEREGDKDILEQKAMDELDDIVADEISETDMLTDAVAAVLSEEAREAYDASSLEEDAPPVFVETEDEDFDVSTSSSEESNFLIGDTDEPEEEVIRRIGQFSIPDDDISSDAEEEVYEIHPKRRKRKRRKVAILEESIASSDDAVENNMSADEDTVGDAVSGADNAVVVSPNDGIEQNEEDAMQHCEETIEDSSAATSAEVAMIVQQHIHGLKNEMLTQAALVAFAVTLIVSCVISLFSLVLVKTILREFIVPRLKDL